MRRRITAVLSFLLILTVMLSSCKTSAEAETPSEIKNLTEADAPYALEYALTTAMIDSGQQLIQDIKTRSLLPKSYAVLEENRNIIPGLNSLLESWDEEFSDYLVQAFESVLESVDMISSDITFSDPFAFVNESDTSTTDYLLKLHGSAILTYIYKIASEADYSTLEKARNQYNIYIRTSNFVNGTDNKELEENNNVDEFASLFYRTFTQLLRTNEKLFRTTPDPYLDPRVKAVFGND